VSGRGPLAEPATAEQLSEGDLVAEEPTAPSSARGPPDAPSLRGGPVWLGLRRRITPGLLLTAFGSSTYMLVLGYLALAKYATFHATYDDLGIENQVLWLLSHGGIPEYYASGFASVYPLQYQKPILFLVLPFYALSPHPETLLVIGTLALGAAAVPLFLAARRWLGRESYALVVVFAYLAYFPVASANLFDFHYEDLFPLLFFTMVWGYASGRRWGMYAAAFLTAAVNPLASVTTIAFLAFTCLPSPTERIQLAWLGFAWTEFRREYRTVVVTFALSAILVVYVAAGVFYTAGVGAHGTSSTAEQVLFGSVNDKLVLLVLLAASLAFLPLYSLRGLVTVMPYVGFVAYSLNSANFQPFGLMYPLLGTGPLFLAALDGLRSAAPGEPTVVPPSPTAPTPTPPPWAASRMQRRVRTSERGRMIRALLVASAAFGLVFFPVSPINAYVEGGYFSGNHDFANITQTTVATSFLNQVVGLVPGDASVLTQNNIPQLSGRDHVQIASDYLPSIPYDAIVMDADVNYFSSPSTILPFVDEALVNGSFGVVAEGYGALYLQRGYSGAPELYHPLNEDFPGTSLTPFLAVPNGTELTGSGPGYSLWYGPFLTLYPGNYSCQFTLTSNTTLPSLGMALTIDVTAANGAALLATESVYPANFTAANQATVFELNFHLSQVATQVELRGMYPTGVAQVS
jgi:uncharacterized membrane protein